MTVARVYPAPIASQESFSRQRISERKLPSDRQSIRTPICLTEVDQIIAALRENPCPDGQSCKSGEYSLSPIDLNGDNQLEFIVTKEGLCGSGGCNEVLLMRSSKGWSLLASNRLGNIAAEEKKTNNMNEISIWEDKAVSDQGITYKVTRFSWDGSVYRPMSMRREGVKPKEVIAARPATKPEVGRQSSASEPKVFRIGETIEVGYTTYTVWNARRTREATTYTSTSEAL